MSSEQAATERRPRKKTRQATVISQEDRLLTLAEVADYIRKSHKFVWEQCRARSMVYLVSGRTWLVRRSEVDRWLKAQTANAVAGSQGQENLDWLESELEAKGLTGGQA